ncbi:hypothetical protein BC829DRAFT_405702 [Chytridium lagenaria]|nr:hypothetical protein BC829DRAFT_405702 [Chytridium lagenaria]
MDVAAVILVSEIGDKTFFIAAVMAMLLSALLGRIMPNLISKQYTQLAAALLFLVFGIKMFYDGYRMTGNETQQELEEVTHELMAKEDDEKAEDVENGGEKPINESFAARLRNLLSYLLTPVFVQTFVLTFLAEWGDRSQIATIALAGAEDFWWVTIGSLIGHSFALGWLSLAEVTLLGGALFLVFAVLSFLNIEVE